MYIVNIPLVMVVIGMFLASVIMVFILHVMASRQIHNYWHAGRYELILLEIAGSIIASAIWPLLALLQHFMRLASACHVGDAPALRIYEQSIPAKVEPSTMMASAMEGEFRNSHGEPVAAGADLTHRV
jgi:hypothetical protein